MDFEAKNLIHQIGETKEGLRPIYLQHGMGGSASSWLVANSDTAFGKVLADRGYDVWMGNTRGNYFSRKHVNYSTKDKEFWDFTIDDLSKDLIANMDFVTKKTGV